MARVIITLLTIFVLACGNKKNEKTVAGPDKPGFTYEQFREQFKTASVPFQMTDTFLLKNTDTNSLTDRNFASLVPDTLKKNIFGERKSIRYVPLYTLKVSADEQYYIVKAQGAATKAALLYAFVKDSFVAVFPFLVPDASATTFQQSTIDKSFSISRSVIQTGDEGHAEGKDVFVFNKDAASFTLIMTDPLDEKSIALLNPIDTFSRANKLAGDYSRDKRNIVSIRDGRRPNLLTVFVHFENENNCNGELKGDAEITSATTAIYRQAGDPCVLQLDFSTSSVKLTELEGCGARRGLECSFNGSYPKNKIPKPKAEKSKKKPVQK
ncbi:MAG TPA: hypothetical protein VM935_14185 [Chitinophagaceae bacterium]|nr:hypothetical protein [Chitinophagaceae bacterium]